MNRESRYDRKQKQAPGLPPVRHLPAILGIVALALLLLSGTAQAQKRVKPAEVHTTIAGERSALLLNGEIVTGGPPDHGGTIWDNAAVTGWWSGPETGYVNLDWGRLDDNPNSLPDWVVDGFMFSYATNNMESQGEDLAIFFYDSCTGWGNLGVQEAGFQYGGLPNGANLPLLPPGSAWIWNLTVDLEDTGYEFLLGYDHGIGLSRMRTPTMGATGLALGDRPNAGGNGATGTKNFYDIYYPNGIYNGTWFFGTTTWATWPTRIYGHEGLATGMEFPFGMGAQGNDAGLYCTGDFIHGETTRFLLRSNGATMQGRLAVSMGHESIYISSLDITRLIGNFTGGSPWDMSRPPIGDFWVYDLYIPSSVPGNLTLYFQGVLSDSPLQAPPMDASNGLRGFLPSLPPPPDVWFEEDKIWAPGYTGNEIFGHSVDMDGIYAVAGAPVLNSDGKGTAYVFEQVGYSWVHIATLTPSDSATYDQFGESVAISGDYIIVGAPWDGLVQDEGAAYIFEKPAGGWATTNQEDMKLMAFDGHAANRFGCSVDIDVTTAVVGALGDQVAGTNYGAAYVYVRESGVWSAKSKLIASDQNSQEGGTLGESVALSGDCIIAGDPNDDDHGDGAGAAYIYEKPGGGWSYPAQLTETAKVTAAGQGASEGDWFGTAVAIEGYTAVVGSPNDDNHPINQGSVHVFERISGTWTTVPVAKLIQRNPIGDADLGSSVAISGDWIVAGSCYAHGSVNRAGAACFYKKPPAGWKNASETDIVEASDGETYDAFGRSVSIDGDYALVGADLDDDPEFGSWTPSSAGSAYIFYLDE